MAQPQKLALSEIQLLQREIEAHGDWLNSEKLERQTEIDRLRMELEALRRAIARLNPDFEADFRQELDRVRRNFNPEG